MYRKLTKAQQQKLWMYDHAKDCTLFSLYKKPSHAKIYAYNRCREERANLYGYGVRVWGNSQIFVYAFRYRSAGEERLHIITPAHNYDFAIGQFDENKIWLVRRY